MDYLKSYSLFNNGRTLTIVAIFTIFGFYRDSLGFSVYIIYLTIYNYKIVMEKYYRKLIKSCSSFIFAKYFFNYIFFTINSEKLSFIYQIKNNL